jgi:hypothetical protein
MKYYKSLSRLLNINKLFIKNYYLNINKNKSSCVEYYWCVNIYERFRFKKSSSGTKNSLFNKLFILLIL